MYQATNFYDKLPTDSIFFLRLDLPYIQTITAFQSLKIQALSISHFIIYVFLCYLFAISPTSVYPCIYVKL